MNYHTSTRIPVNDYYATMLGKAVYMFAYYEWTIIYIIEHLKPGFVSEYSRPTNNPLTSGAVRKKLNTVINQTSFPISGVAKTELEDCLSHFDGLIDKRNALIHAHPITDSDGSQILAYQTKVSKPISDKKWPNTEVEKLIQEIDKVAVLAGKTLDKLRNRS